MRAAIIAVLWMVIWPFGVACGQESPPVSVSDCVRMKYLERDYFHPALAISPQGNWLAYLVKSPNLVTNRNDIQLYLKRLDEHGEDGLRGDDPGVLALSASAIAQIQWLHDGKRLILITPSQGRSAIIVLNTRTLAKEVVASVDGNITEYSIGKEDRRIMFIAQKKSAVTATGPTPEEIDRGYVVPFERETQTPPPQSMIFLTDRSVNGKWSLPQHITLQSPVTGGPVRELHGSLNLRLSLSPNGKLFLVTYLSSQETPPSWKKSPLVRGRLDAGGTAMVTIMQNLVTGQSAIPLESPSVFSIPAWSSDSTGFAVVAESPVGSQWEESDARETHGTTVLHLFYVDVRSSRVEEIAPHVEGIQGPLWQRPDGAMFLHTDPDELSTAVRDGNHWRVESAERIPITGFFSHGELASNGVVTVGDYETTDTPPRLFLHRPGRKAVDTLVDMNPEMRRLQTAPIEEIKWTTSDGRKIDGLMIKPIGYQSGTRYPLVIQTKPVGEQFLCDTGESHYPSFAPQPMAAAGVLYVAREDVEGADDAAAYPQGYPGGITEAAFNMDVWDRLIDLLDQRGLIDTGKVGMIGFSRTGWYTEFALEHARHSFAAATLADNVSYTLSEYWLFHSPSVVRGYDAMYGGPPYGKSLKNWMQYSTSFNLEKIHTPILMEVMGYGVPWRGADTPPVLLSARYELLTGLSLLKKPVELYYYPNEDHQPDHPKARLATLERNVDWYRFWLQGYKRSHPEDPDQYQRWEHLRELRDADQKAVGLTGGDSLPSKTPN